MKKLLVFLITFFTFSLINVDALDISIDSVKVKDKSNDLEVGEVKVEGLTISPSINFKEVGESVTYEIKLKKDNKNNYIIKNIVDDNFNKGIVTSYQYSKDLSKPILLTIKYEEKGQSLDKVNINIEIEEVSNPKTGIALFFIITSIILVWTYAIIDSKKQKQVNIKVFLLGLLLLPLTSVFAAEKISLVVNGEDISSPKGMKVVYRKTEDSISVGDEYKIDTEHFYVVSSSAEETVLLAKDNLYVGFMYHFEGSINNLIKDKLLDSSDEGYCLQNEKASGFIIDENYYIGLTPFSWKNYWVDQNRNLLPKYRNNESSSWKSNNIYDRDYLDLLPSDYKNLNEEKNDFSIAKYVEEYIEILKELGAPINIKGRLLTYEEAVDLGCVYTENCQNAPIWLNTSSYWLGSAETFILVISINDQKFKSSYYLNGESYGVRPVIVVPTSELS